MTTCLQTLTDEGATEERDMTGFWRNLFPQTFDGSVYIMTIGRLSPVEVCQVLHRSMILSKTELMQWSFLNYICFPLQSLTKKWLKAVWMLDHSKSDHFSERVFSTFLPVCLNLHSKSPLPDIMRQCLSYTDRWKSPLGTILCFKKLMSYMGYILQTS